MPIEIINPGAEEPAPAPVEETPAAPSAEPVEVPAEVLPEPVVAVEVAVPEVALEPVTPEPLPEPITATLEVAPEPVVVEEPVVAEPIPAPVEVVPEPEPVVEPTPVVEVADEPTVSGQIREIDQRVAAAMVEHDTLGNELAFLEQRVADLEAELQSRRAALLAKRDEKHTINQRIANLRTLREVWPDQPGERAIFATKDPAYVEMVEFSDGGLVTTRLQVFPSKLKL